MNVAELFITLGIKGTEKTIGGIKGAKDMMGSLGSASLETKAALLGAAYAFEKLMASSSQAGTNLKNFEALTGISAQTLQKYQYAGRQVGLSNEEMTGSFKSLYQGLEDLRMGKAPAAGLSYLQQKTGFRIDKAVDLKTGKTDMKYVMDNLQKFFDSEQNIMMRNAVAKSFNLGEGVMAGFARGGFRPGALKGAPTYSEKEIGELDKANVAWKNLGNKVEMAFGHFNAKHGVEMVNALSKITSQIIKLVEQLLKLANALHLFEGLGKVLAGISGAAGLLTEGVEAISSPKKKEKFIEHGSKLLGETKQNATALGNYLMSGISKHFPSVATSIGPKSFGSPHVNPSAIAPKVGHSVAKNSTQNNNVNQTFHFQTDGANHQAVGDAAQKGITRAFNQTPAGVY